MKLLDIHCHLDLISDSAKLPEFLNEANKLNVNGFIVPGLNGEVEYSPLYQKYLIWRTWGIHPAYSDQHEIKHINENIIKKLEYEPVAIGECGLDKRLSISLHKQIEFFERQIFLANENKIPLIVHLIGHWDEAITLLKKATIPVIMHSYSGSKEIAKRFLDLGFYLSFSGAICRKGFTNAKISAQFVPLDRVFIETDSPDMKPDNFTKEQNNPSSLPIILETLAEIKNLNKTVLANAISDNIGVVFPKIHSRLYLE